MQQLEKPRQGYKLVKSFFGNYEEIPQEWDFITFSDIASIKRGASPRPIEDPRYFGKGRGWIRIGDVSNSYKYLVKTTDYLSELGESKSVPVNEGDLIMSIAATVGKPIILKMKACIHDGFVTFSNLSSDINTEFLFYLLTKIENKLKSLGQHGTQSNLNADLVSRITFAKPTLKEQQKIAEILSNIDDLINNLEALIEKKKNIKQGAMQELLTGKRRLEGFSGDWEVKTLSECGKITMGQSPDSEYYNNKGQGLPLIQGNADIKNRETIIRSFSSMSPKKGKKGDIILTVRAPVGQVAKASFDCCLGRGVCAISSKNDYLYYHLMFIENKWKSMSTGSTFDSINSKELNKLQLKIPKLIEEQIRITTILSEMDNEISELEKQRDKYIMIKQGMMQKLLTGEIRLV
ncbi:MAG: hypothetical protein FJ356_06535 [Thaumarchaeota archaeon]|nr:hypothetical protein [Nitrososphaerota archaeon]